MNETVIESVKTNENTKTYSLPVMITAGVALVLTLMVGIFSVMSSSRVREADPATISEARNQASQMVPVENQETKQSIETARLDAETNQVPANLNLKDVFTGTLGSDRPVTNAPAVSPVRQNPQPAVTNGIQPGLQPTVAKRPKKDLMASKMPDRPAPPLLPSFESRYQTYEQQFADAQRTQLPEPNIGQIYAVSEVVPTGYMAAGDRKLVNFEVNISEKDLSPSFSLETGERLFDATIAEVNDEGVFYQMGDGSRVFTKFVNESDLKTRQPSQPATVITNPSTNGTNNRIGEIIPVKPTDVFRKTQTSGKPEFKNLMAALGKSDMQNELKPGVFYKKDYVSDDKNPATDVDYFHPVGYFEVNAPSGIEPKKKDKDLTPCDKDFVGQNIRYTSDSSLTLTQFLRGLQKFYGFSFIVDKDVPDEPVTLKVADKPWNYVLEGILRSKGLEARCLMGDIISIEPKGKQSKVDQENEKQEQERQKTEPLFLRKYNLRYIPLNSSSSTQIAGSVGGLTGGGGGNGGSGGNSGPGIEGQLNQLLTRGGDNRATVSRIPNSNILAVYATERQHKEIDGFIKEIDQPGFQVIIETNFYTVNDTNFRDLGGQFSAILGNGPGTQIGGITNIASGTDSTDGGNAIGNSRNLPPSFGQPNNNLRAGGNAIFGGSFTVGTATFQALYSAAQQKGLANSQARSVQAILDGGTTEIRNGDSIIIPTTAGINGTTGAVTVNATQSALMQPQVVVDDKGEPVAVTLNLQLSNNSINRAYLGTATPVIATQSQSGTVRLPLNQTYVVSGFFTDSSANTRNETPGLSKIPGLGELFKRRTTQLDRNRLYFAISVRVVRDTDLIKVPAPSDIDTSPVPPPAPQEPSVRKEVKKKKS